MRLKTYISQLDDVVKAYPVSVLWTLGIMIGGLIASRPDAQLDEPLPLYFKITLAAIFAFPWIYHAEAARKYFRSEHWWSLFIAIPVLLIGVYWLGGEIDPMNGYRLGGLVVLSQALAIAHMYRSAGSDKEYWYYMVDHLKRTIIAAGLSFILVIILSVALIGVRYLFQVQIDDARYAQLGIVIASIINVLIFLGLGDDENYTREMVDQRFIHVLLLFILLPAIIIYTLLLYSFSIKIALSGVWPEGWVGKLCLCYFGLIAFAYVISKYTRSTKRWATTLLRNRNVLWFLAIIPLVVFSMGLQMRVVDYGWTEHRWVAVSMGCIALANIAYHLIKKEDQLFFIPLCTGVFAVLFMLPVIGGSAVSAKSQSARLIHCLQEPSPTCNASRIARFLDERVPIDFIKNELPSGAFNAPIDSITSYTRLQQFLKDDLKGQQNAYRDLEYLYRKQNEPIYVDNNTAILLQGMYYNGTVWGEPLSITFNNNNQSTEIRYGNEENIIDSDTITPYLEKILKAKNTNTAAFHYRVSLDSMDMTLILDEVRRQADGTLYYSFQQVICRKKESPDRNESRRL